MNYWLNVHCTSSNTPAKEIHLKYKGNTIEIRNKYIWNAQKMFNFYLNVISTSLSWASALQCTRLALKAHRKCIWNIKEIYRKYSRKIEQIHFNFIKNEILKKSTRNIVQAHRKYMRNANAISTLPHRGAICSTSQNWQHLTKALDFYMS